MKPTSFLILLTALLIFLLTACSTTHTRPLDGPPNLLDIEKIPEICPKAEPRSKYGNPECYDVDGQRYYVLKSARGYCKTGLASWYGTKFHGRNTSSREPYDMFAMTAASRNLPLPTYVEVTNLETGKKIIVKVNDRGPFKSDRIIDLSYAAAKKLGFANKGTANVQVRAIDTSEIQDHKISQEILLADNGNISEIQINPVALPLPQQMTKPITLERYVQVGAFANHDNAVRLKREIAATTEAPVLIKEGQTKSKIIYRVQIGPFKSIDESEAIIQMLQDKGQQAVTVFS